MSIFVRLAIGTVLAFCAALAAAGRVEAWDVVQSGVTREAPECVSWAAGRLDCFVRASNGHLNWLVYAQGKWAPAQDLGGNLPVAVSCVVRGPGGINCFAPSAKGVLAEIHLNGAKWSAWASLGGELAAGRAFCLSLATDHIVCFARGRSGGLMSRGWDGGAAWNQWRDLGGALSADPACVALGGTRVACFGRGAKGDLVGYLPNDSGNAGAWVTYGGQVEGRPSCGVVSASDVACAVRGADQRLYVLRATGIAGRFNGKLVASNDQATGDPTCVVSAGSFTCFARDQSHHLLRRTIAANGDMSDGRKLGDAPESTGIACLPIQSGALGCLIVDTERRLQFAMGGELNGAQIADTDAGAGVDESPQGNWYLSSLETNLQCRVRLFSDKDNGENRLELGRDCEGLPGLRRATQWQADEDLLLFTTPRGRPVVRFRLTGSGRWISPMPRMPYMLSREQPEGSLNAPSDDAPGLRFEEGDLRGVVGQWRLNADASGQSCGVRLTDWPAGSGNAVVLKGACPSALNAAQYWSIDANAVVLASGDGRIVARFKRRSPDEWDGESAQGTRSYKLTR